jgi:hypothetical protein
VTDTQRIVRRARTTRGGVTHPTSAVARRDGERIEIGWVTVHSRVAGLP